jgi:hypothetical protein
MINRAKRGPFTGLPKERPSLPPNSSNGHREFAWEALVATVLHPVKVATIEALLWIEQPLSSTELVNLFDHRGWPLGVVSYHVSALAKLGVIEATDERQVRGARETYHYLAQR